jgi:type IV secretory pathway TrbD component
MGLDYGRYLQPPLTFIRFPYWSWEPWQLGLCYLVPPDLAFSLIVFDLMWMAQYVLAGHLGWCSNPWGGFPYGDQQAAGGLLALLLLILWSDRNYLSQVFRRTLGLQSILGDDAREALSYRSAVIGAVIGFGLLTWILLHAGMKLWVILVFLLLYFAICLMISRLRAQLGPPDHALLSMMPNSIMTTLFGTHALGGSSLGLFALMGTYLREQRTNPAPMQLEAMKMAATGLLERRRISLGLVAIVPFSVLCYFWASLDVGYRFGMGTGETSQGALIPAKQYIYQMHSGIQNPAGPEVSGIIAMTVGGVFTAVMMALKYHFAWWPLHPVAYPLALSFTTEYFTLALLVTWLIKSLVLRYGGLRAYRASLPIFLGLLVGGATVSLLERILHHVFKLQI